MYYSCHTRKQTDQQNKLTAKTAVLLVALRLGKTLGFVSGNTILVARMLKPWQLVVRDVFFRPVMRIQF